jgi:hypothetical protein
MTPAAFGEPFRSPKRLTEAGSATTSHHGTGAGGVGRRRRSARFGEVSAVIAIAGAVAAPGAAAPLAAADFAGS